MDDESANVRLLERLLQHEGYTHVRATTDPRQVHTLFRAFQPDLVLLDLAMPHLDGFAVMEQLAELTSSKTYLPILVLTADIASETRRRALGAGAKDFLTKPFDAAEVGVRIGNLLETRFLYRELEAQNQRLAETVRERTNQLLQSEKLATMGTLLAGVAHELNNPLAVVLGQAWLLRAGGKGKIADRAGKIAQAAERCVRIVKGFLGLARQHPPERQLVALNALVREDLELLAYQLRVESVEVVRDLAGDLPPLLADGHQLHQAVINLITNAVQAMRRTSGLRQLTVRTRYDMAGGQLTLEIGDTGPGIPPDIQTRIFEPFFTTKPPGEGTGLGLALCLGIVEGHGGRLSVQTEVGRGTVFRIDLPHALEEEHLASPPVSAPPTVRGKTILVMDDEPGVAEVLAEMLAQDEHEVVIAASGAQGLARMGERAYDVIFSDVRMPGLDGPGVYAELERRDPLLLRRLIFLTGDILTPHIREFLRASGRPELAKPFSPADVHRVVQHVLQQA